MTQFIVGFTHTMASFLSYISKPKFRNITINLNTIKSIFIYYSLISCAWSAHAETQMIYVQYSTERDIDIIVADVYPDVAPDNTYFAAINWWGGYCGIQYLPNNISSIIFSQFQPQRDGYATALSLADGGTLRRADEGQENAEFHSNAISYRNNSHKFPTRQWYRFVVRSWDDEIHKNLSQIGLWTQGPSGEWTHQATFVLPGQHVPLYQPTSFVEDWQQDGKTRRGLFRRFLLHHASGEWNRLPPTPGILTIPSGSPDNRYNASVVKGGISLQIGDGTLPSSNIGRQMDVKNDESIDIKQEVKITDTSITEDKTTINNFYVIWTFRSTVPQFRYSVDLFADNKCEGSQLAHAEGYDSDLKYVTLPARRSSAEGLYAKYTISDIYDNTDTECFSASGK